MSNMKPKIAAGIIIVVAIIAVWANLLFLDGEEVQELSTRDHPDWWRPVGGQNSQDSTLERRSLIWNDNDVEDGVDPPEFYEDVKRKGKFYPRGCRGMIEQIEIYCVRTAAGTLTVRWSAHPGLGPVWERVITPGADWAWRTNFINQMWNYDSLFIWISECDPDVSWGYDAVEPYDGHRYIAAQGRWAAEDTRPFIRAVYTGETPGDVPISGVVNTVKIPSVGSEQESGIVATADGVWATLLEVERAGTLVQTRVTFVTAVPPAVGVTYQLRVYVDGARVYIIGNVELTQSVVATNGRSSCGEFVQTATETILQLRVPLEFRRSIRIDGRQSSGAGCNATCNLTANMMQ